MGIDWGYIRSCEILAGVDLIVSDHCIFYETDFCFGHVDENEVFGYL